MRNQGAGGILRRRSADVPGRGARQERGQPALADLVRACGSVGLRGEERASCAGGPENRRTGEP